jgi:energy-converting hydrogenase B subunit D
MMSMSPLIVGMTLLLCVTLIGAALVAIRAKGLPIAILASGLVSLIASILFLVLAAPDVAMTEAAIGSGLTTFLFFFVLARIRATGPDVANNDAEMAGDKHD